MKEYLLIADCDPHGIRVVGEYSTYEEAMDGVSNPFHLYAIYKWNTPHGVYQYQIAVAGKKYFGKNKHFINRFMKYVEMRGSEGCAVFWDDVAGNEQF